MNIIISQTMADFFPSEEKTFKLRTLIKEDHFLAPRATLFIRLPDLSCQTSILKLNCRTPGVKLICTTTTIISTEG